MSPTSNPPIIEEFKKEFVVQEPPRTAHKGKPKKNILKSASFDVMQTVFFAFTCKFGLVL